MADDYEVISQRQTSTLSQSGGLLDEWEIVFATIPEGIQDLVRVPISQRSAPVVREMIEAKVAEIKQIAAL